MPSRGQHEDLTGRRFGHLVVERLFGRNQHSILIWKCVCDCGGRKYPTGNALKDGRTVSCGCVNDENRKKICSDRITHGHATRGKTRVYNTWCGMIARCYNKRSPSYKNYGGRGITVCDRWRNSFENFFADMGYPPSPNLTIERDDNNGNYNLLNCRWATKREQANNTRRNRRIEICGQRLTLAQAARKFRISPRRLVARLALGWSPERACTEPLTRR